MNWRNKSFRTVAREIALTLLDNDNPRRMYSRIWEIIIKSIGRSLSHAIRSTRVHWVNAAYSHSAVPDNARATQKVPRLRGV